MALCASDVRLTCDVSASLIGARATRSAGRGETPPIDRVRAAHPSLDLVKPRLP
jgi:hypothetical protein